MGFLKRLFCKSDAIDPLQDPIADIKGDGSFDVDVVGESNYQDALEKICGGKTRDGVEKYVKALLILEDTNKYDNKAVCVAIEGKIVGYLSSEVAREYRKKLKELIHPRIVGVCNAVIRGGWDRGGEDKGYFGVKLDIFR